MTKLSPTLVIIYVLMLGHSDDICVCISIQTFAFGQILEWSVSGCWSVVKLIYYRVIQIRLIHSSGSARGLLQSSKLFSKYSWWNIFIMWICVLTASKQVGPVLWLLLVRCFFNENQKYPGETVSTCVMLITTGHIVSSWNF